MNQTICLMCGDPVSLCACRTSPLTPDALERALRARVAELETAALRDEDKLQAADARAFEAEHKLEKAEKMIEALHAARNVMAGDINMGLATERDAALLRLGDLESEREVLWKLRDQLMRDVADSVPRSRVYAMDDEITTLGAKLSKVQKDAGAEIERLQSSLGAIRTAFDRWDGGQGDQWELLNELERILKGGAVESRPQLVAWDEETAVNTYFRTAAAAMESNEPSDGLPITATLVEKQSRVCDCDSFAAFGECGHIHESE